MGVWIVELEMTLWPMVIARNCCGDSDMESNPGTALSTKCQSDTILNLGGNTGYVNLKWLRGAPMKKYSTECFMVKMTKFKKFPSEHP